MATITKDLGVVTAYAYAVEGGYTGTEEEFTALLGHIAEILNDLDNFSVTVTTLPAGSTATASYENGVLSLGIPKGDKGDTGATPHLTIGTVTTGAAGSSADASFTGTDENPVLNLTIPKGDPGEVPAESIAPTEASTTAAQKHEIGERFWLSGTLYIATATIAAGSTIVTSGSGANCKADVLGDDVTAQSDRIDDLKSAIDYMRDDEYSEKQLSWHIGTIDGGNGLVKTSDTTRLYSDLIDFEYATFVISKNNYAFSVFAYDAQDSSYVGWFHGDGSFAPGSGTKLFIDYFLLKEHPNYKYRFVLRKPDGTQDIAISEGANCVALDFDIDDRLSDIEDVLEAPTMLTWAQTDKRYIATNGTSINPESPYSSSNSYHGKCTFMACSPGDIFIVSTKGGSNYRPYVFCKSNGDIITTALGSNVQYHNERVVAPADAAYVGFNSGPDDAYGTVQVGEYIFETLQHEIDALPIESPYKNKKCVAFGTSLTYRDSGYRPYLAELLGMTIDNQGDGSAHWYWYNDTDNVLYNVTNYTGYSDKDVCIIEGCVNDWGANRALGTYKDTGTDSVCGCLYNMISYVYSQKPGIQIIVILDHFGRVNGSTDTSSSALNNDNKTQYDFYEECAKLCEFYGIPCVKEYALSSIGIFGTEYLSDNIHLNTLGAQQSAQTIASVMMNIKPKKVSS